MSQIKRSSLVRGGAQVEFNGEQYLAATKVGVDWGLEFKDVPSSFAGALAPIRTARKGTVSMDLCGVIPSDFNNLFPYRDPAAFPFGKSIVPDPDQPLIIRPFDATQPQIRYHAAGFRKMVDMKLSATDPIFSGNMEFGLYPKDDTDDGDPDLLYIEEANEIGTTVPIAYDPADLIITPYTLSYLSTGTVTWHWSTDDFSSLPFFESAADLATALNAGAAITTAGGVTVTGNYVDGYIIEFVSNGSRSAFTGTIAGNVPTGLAFTQTVITAGSGGVKQKVKIRLTPWANFTHQDGVSFSFGITTSEQANNALGTVDEYLTGSTASLKCTPQGPSEAAIRAALNLQGPNSRLGLPTVTPNDLNVIGGVYLRLYRAIMKAGPHSYGATDPRIGECEWQATRSVLAGGDLNPLFDISLTPLTYS